MPLSALGLAFVREVGQLVRFLRHLQPRILGGEARRCFDLAFYRRWPMNKIAEALTQAGFELIVQHSNPRSPHAYITACAAPGFS